MLAVRARALIEGRLAPSIDDVVALAEPVLKHRMALTFAARADGETVGGIIARLDGAARRLKDGCMARVRVLGEETRSPRRGETEAALTLADRMPRLVLEARRVAATLSHGLHGRRRAGAGETFWQFRPFVAGEAAQRIDWRRSARDDRLYVREREWETAQSVWLWIDRSASMGYVSDLAQAPKIERALVLGLALADAFVEGGERVGLLGLMPRARLAPDRRDASPRRSSATPPASTTTCRRGRRSAASTRPF